MFHVPAHKDVVSPAGQVAVGSFNPEVRAYEAYKAVQLKRAANRERVYVLGFEDFIRFHNKAAA